MEVAAISDCEPVFCTATPCRCLIAAMIERALLDLDKESEHRRAAEMWLFKSGDREWGLKWCADHINRPVIEIWAEARKRMAAFNAPKFQKKSHGY